MIMMTVRKLGPPQQQKLPRGMKYVGKYERAKSIIAGVIKNIITSS